MDAFSIFLFSVKLLWAGLPLKVVSGFPGLDADLRKAFSFLQLSLMLALDLIRVAFVMLRNIPPISNLFRVFILKGYSFLLK